MPWSGDVMVMGLGLFRRGLAVIPSVLGGGLITGATRQSGQLAWQGTQLAWQGAWLVTTPVRQTASALAALPGDMVDELAGPERRVWTYADGRVHVRLRGTYGPAAQWRRQRIERTLQAHPGIRWVRVNHALGRVIVGLADP